MIGNIVSKVRKYLAFKLFIWACKLDMRRVADCIQELVRMAYETVGYEYDEQEETPHES